MAAVSCDDVGCRDRHRTFQDLVVVWVCRYGLELAADGNDSQKREQIRHSIERLLRSEAEFRLQFFRQLVQQLTTGYTIDHAGPRNSMHRKGVPFQPTPENRILVSKTATFRTDDPHAEDRR